MADRAGIRLTFGKRGLIVSATWYTFPVQRATERFERIRAWLEESRAFDWDRIESAAAYFHPALQVRPDTGVLDPLRAPGSLVYLAMERGEYSPEMVRIVTPTIWRQVLESGPIRSRGKSGAPIAFAAATLMLAAMLACHEYANLEDELASDDPSGERLAQHLYYFERFAALWARTGVSRPASLAVTAKKRDAASAWLRDLLRFHDGRVRAAKPGLPRVSPRDSAEKWTQRREVSGVTSPGADHAYRELLKALGKRNGK